MEFCALRCICGSLGKAFFNQFFFIYDCISWSVHGKCVEKECFKTETVCYISLRKIFKAQN